MATVRYARSGDVHIAYAVSGEGPVDVVIVPGFLSNVELDLENPQRRHLFDRLGRFARVIRFDKRNTGLSDRVAGHTLEQRMDDLRAVMDDAASERAVVYGVSEGSSMAALFAATYPQRTLGLVLTCGFARFLRDDDYPWGLPPEVLDRFTALVEAEWGTGMTRAFVSAHDFDEETVGRMARFERHSATPRAAAETMRMNGLIDVRSVLPSVHTPTLVLYTRTDQAIRYEASLYLAEHIPGARAVELSRRDHLAMTEDEVDEEVDEIEEFVTGVRPVHDDVDRVLTTLLFTDVVDSTATAAHLGDRPWVERLQVYLDATRAEVERHRGRLVKDTGDGVLATFDGPARAVRCAAALRDAARRARLESRAGVHTGEVELAGSDVRGMAVHIAARVAGLAGPGEVLVSSTVRDLVTGAGLQFADRGATELRGVPGSWRVLALET